MKLLSLISNIDSSAIPWKSEQFLSALILVIAGLAVQFVIHILLPSRRAKHARLALTTAGVTVNHQNQTLNLPVPAEILQRALQSLFDKPMAEGEGTKNEIRIPGVPSSHWNVNRIHPLGFHEARIFVEASGQNSCHVRREVRHTGQWRSVITIAGTLIAVGILCSLGTQGAETAPYVVSLLFIFSVLFLCLRAVGQRLTTRAWFKEQVLAALREAQSNPDA